MHRATGALAAIVLASGMALTPTPATAATGEFGNTCTGSATVGNVTSS